MSKISERSKIEEGRGKDSGPDYKLWIKIREISSLGTASTVQDYKNGREVHLLSQGEVYYYYLLRWDDSVVDIREQFPLDLATTKAICDEMGYKIIRLELGILSFPGVTFTQHEIMVHKYLIRNGKRIGYLTDHSFAHELGLREEKPQRIGIVNSQESQLHGRNRTFLGMDLKIHGSRISVDNSNYPILATISFVLNEKRLKCCTQGNKNEVLRQWLAEKNVVLADFEPYYQHFPSWTRNMIAEIFAEDIT